MSKQDLINRLQLTLVDAIQHGDITKAQSVSLILRKLGA